MLGLGLGFGVRLGLAASLLFRSARLLVKMLSERLSQCKQSFCKYLSGRERGRDPAHPALAIRLFPLTESLEQATDLKTAAWLN